MRKITVIIALFILLPLWAAETGRYHSRGNAFEITVGGGYSSLGYKVNKVADQLASKTSGSYSLQAHIGYNWFFCEYAGLAVGADIQHYGQKATLNGLLTWSGVTDNMGQYRVLDLVTHGLRDSRLNIGWNGGFKKVMRMSPHKIQNQCGYSYIFGR